MKNSKIKKLLAFTLAETLVVIGIIGVVSALTLPNLNSSTGNKEKIAQLKKVYSNLNDAFGRAEATFGPYEEWFRADTTESARSTRLANRIKKFSKVTKDCGLTDNNACFTQKDASFTDSSLSKNNQYTYANGNTYKMILNDGTALSFSVTGTSTTPSTMIFIDLDGPNKGKSKWGNDLFYVTVSKDSVGKYILTYTSPASGDNPCRDDNDACIAWVLQNDNMEYLDTTDGTTCKNNTSRKLTWGGETTCK